MYRKTVRHTLWFLCCCLLWACSSPEPTDEKPVESVAEKTAGPEPVETGDTSVFEGEESATGEPNRQDGGPDTTPPESPPPEAIRTSYTIDPSEWTETAVRKVLHVFAFGSFASDAQIKTWAAMTPEEAINEMLSFQRHHAKLSPPDPLDQLDQKDGSLAALGKHWASSAKDNPTPTDTRQEYKVNVEGESVSKIWVAAATRRGINPVRHKIGLWETNYHLAVNRRAGVNNDQILVYYDAIMDALAAGKPYQDVLAIASVSAAVATQYNHRENIFKDGKFLGNEDFAREIFQLYFGILGEGDATYHEFTSIRNTAKALTDMQVQFVQREGGGSALDTKVKFGTKLHYPGSLEILKKEIKGATAKEKIENLAQVAIQHQESLNNLPVLIVRDLADDNLNDEKRNIIRNIWADLKAKDLLTFLKQYAISKAFHHPTRLKYWSGIHRNVTAHNLITQGNQASYLDLYKLNRNLRSEDVTVFEPSHDVFGGQTGIEASQSKDVFRSIYTRSTELLVWIARTHWPETGNVVWEKNWGAILPQESDKTYRVKQVAEWLWQRFVADGLKRFGALERAHVYALLASGTDLGYWMDPKNPTRVYTKTELETDPFYKERVSDGGKARIDGLASKESKLRRTANHRIGLAIAFILATPYAFAQEGK